MARINKIDAKEFWRLFGVFTAVIAVLALMNFALIKASGKKWRTGLEESVQAVLDEKYPGKWRILGFKEIQNPFSASAACYEIQSTENAAKSNAVILRTQTLYGPFPAVFIYDGKSSPEFVGYSGVHGKVRPLMEERPTDIFISRWAGKIPEIIGLE